MATGKRRGSQPAPPPSVGQDWRHLGRLDRFAVLLNHYGSAQALSDASGIPARSLRAVFTSAVINGKKSNAINSDVWIKGFQRARRRMTDHNRRVIEKANKGAIHAPIVRTPTNIIEPKRYRGTSILRDYTGKLREMPHKSAWSYYKVEFLSEAEIRQILEDLFAVFMDTGQFNSMRYEYIVEADTYSNGMFMDKDLRAAAEEMRFIKMSTGQFPFSEYSSPPEFADAVFNGYPYGWQYLKSQGGVRITGLFFTSFDDIEASEPMMLARLDYNKWKRGKRGKGKKRGDGRGI